MANWLAQYNEKKDYLWLGNNKLDQFDTKVIALLKVHKYGFRVFLKDGVSKFPINDSLTKNKFYQEYIIPGNYSIQQIARYVDELTSRIQGWKQENHIEIEVIGKKR